MFDGAAENKWVLKELVEENKNLPGATVAQEAAQGVQRPNGKLKWDPSGSGKVENIFGARKSLSTTNLNA